MPDYKNVRNIIITPAFGYDIDQVKIFLKSAEKSNIDARIILMRATKNKTFYKKILKYNSNAEIWVPPFVKFHEIGRKMLSRGPMISIWPYFIEKIRLITKKNSFIDLLLLPFCLQYVYARHYYSYNFIVNNYDKINNIIITDVRDVVFQHDPFKYINDALITGAEPQRIKDSLWTTKNMLRTTNDKNVLKLLDKQVLCAGVVGGKKNVVVEYLKVMITEISNKFRKITMVQGDQGLHNYVLWAGKLNVPIQVSENGKGPIATIGLCNERDISSLNILSENNPGNYSKPAIIHQYDRIMHFNDRIIKKYG